MQINLPLAVCKAAGPSTISPVALCHCLLRLAQLDSIYAWLLLPIAMLLLALPSGCRVTILSWNWHTTAQIKTGAALHDPHIEQLALATMGPLYPSTIKSLAFPPASSRCCEQIITCIKSASIRLCKCLARPCRFPAEGACKPSSLTCPPLLPPPHLHPPLALASSG